MPLVQDSFRQKSRKLCKSLILIGDTTKRLNADPKDVWVIKEGRSESENDSGTDSEEIYKKSTLKCEGNDDRKCQQQKSVSYQYTSGEYNSPKSDYSIEDDRCCMKVVPEGRCPNDKEHCCHAYNVAEYRKICAAETKSYGYKQIKQENSRRRNSKEEIDSAPRWLPPRYHSKSCNVRNKKQWECEEKLHRCDECCNRPRFEEEKKPIMLMYTKPYKHVHPLKKDRPSEWKWKGKEEYHSADCCPHKQKMKVLDSYEELPAVDEALERRSDETYKASSYTKFTMNVGDSQTNFPQNKIESSEMYEGSPSWFLCDKMSGTALNESLPYHPERATKTRSRRTRIKRSVKWIKALVHPVVEGSRKEKVGVMILGRNGPEYYSKYSSKKSCIPFRKTWSFQEGPTKSYDMPFNFEPKEIFFSASDPGRKPRNELRTLEENKKIEEETRDIDKNVDDLVKNMEEKFLESISKEQFQEDIKEPESPNKVDSKVSKLEESKKCQNLMPRELLSSRAPKSTRKYDRDVFTFNVESKTIAESLNEKAKQFRIGQKSDLTELEKKFPPKAVDKETRDANLTLWGINELRELSEVTDAGGEGDGNDLSLRIPLQRTSQCTETQSKSETDEKGKTGEEPVSKEKETQKTPVKGKESGKDKILFDIFKNLVKDGSAITEKESEKIQKVLQKIGYEPELTSSEMDSKMSCDETIRENDEESKKGSSNRKHSEDFPSDRTVKYAGNHDYKWKSGKTSKKRDINMDKLKIIRQALPSMAAENEAAHLKQLKGYLIKFIDRLESEISSEVRGRRHVRCKQHDTTSSDSSEVKVDARKLIDLVSNPFKRITSDMTIDMAKKLTDALVQENSSKTAKKTRKNSEETEDVSLQCPTTSRSDGEDEVELGRTGKYLKRLKRMRNDHLRNIIMEVKSIRELNRYLDRCSRLKL